MPDQEVYSQESDVEKQDVMRGKLVTEGQFFRISRAIETAGQHWEKTYRVFVFERLRHNATGGLPCPRTILSVRNAVNRLP